MPKGIYIYIFSLSSTVWGLYNRFLKTYDSFVLILKKKKKGNSGKIMLKADVYHDAIHFLLLLFIIKTLLLAFVLESVIFVATS